MKKRNAKWLCGMSAFAVCALLAGCGHEHTWTEATCTEPKTCSECGETEGEALGHAWAEATCTEPKTCRNCGETEGEALGHTWTEANYQTAQTCSVCGTTEGEPLAASFETHGITINAEEGVTYDYLTVCYENTSKTTTGHATFSDYRIVKEDADLGLERKDGYEWRIVHISATFNDANANNYGILVGSCQENYYDIEGWDGSGRYDEETGRSYYTVSYNGTEYECCLVSESGWSGWSGGAITDNIDYYVQVPVGYDGVVVGLYNKQHTWEDGMYIYDIADENTLS